MPAIDRDGSRSGAPRALRRVVPGVLVAAISAGMAPVETRGPAIEPAPRRPRESIENARGPFATIGAARCNPPRLSFLALTEVARHCVSSVGATVRHTGSPLPPLEISMARTRWPIVPVSYTHLTLPTSDLV